MSVLCVNKFIQAGKSEQNAIRTVFSIRRLSPMENEALLLQSVTKAIRTSSGHELSLARPHAQSIHCQCCLPPPELRH